MIVVSINETKRFQPGGVNLHRPTMSLTGSAAVTSSR